MIIKSNRVATTASRRRLIDHLLHGDENDAIEIIQGGERDIADFWRDAQIHDAIKALRVWILAPSEPTTREQFFECLVAVAQEFGFDPSLATVVEHVKPRAHPDSFDRHWHVVIGEVDPVTGRVLSSSHDHARQEYLSRTLEARFRHQFTLGAHTKAVLARMRRENQLAVADALAAILEEQSASEVPREAFTTAQHQAAKRQGTSLPQVREAVATAWRTSDSWASFNERIASLGLELSPGDVAGEWLVRREGEALLGSLRRLVKVRKAVFENRMKEWRHEHGSSDPGSVPGGDGLVGNPTGAGGDRGDQEVRERSRSADRGRGVVPGHSDTAPGHAGRGNRRNAQAPGGAPRRDGGARHREGDAVGDHRGLTEEVVAFTAAIIDLLPLAGKVAQRGDSIVATVLDEQEAIERTRLATVRVAPSQADVDLSKANVEVLRRKLNVLEQQIFALNDEIGTLFVAQRDRRNSFWGRLFPHKAADEKLEHLRARRAGLMREQKVETRPLLAALAAEERAERAFKEARIKSKIDDGKEAAMARVRLSAIARARALLRRLPTLAYVGARTLLATAVRIDQAKERGWKSGLDTTPSSSQL